MKQLVFTFFIFGLLLISNTSSADEPEVLNEYFGPGGIKDKYSAYYGEMLEYYVEKPTLGENLPADVSVTYRKLSQTENRAVYAVLLSDGKQSQDWYVFLIKDKSNWKIEAIRGLALPGLFFLFLEELEKKTSRTQEEEWTYQNMLLTSKSDKYLKVFFRDNLNKFKEILKFFTTGDKERSKKTAKKLFLNSVYKDGGVINFNIGGMIDNSVGFLYVPVDKSPPSMSPKDFIYIEQITDGWYIYKTT
ncbi:MAG: hypothetical protein OEV42_09395 [Deltaproteobacteria bacterium]|nr:hypothetical protein [Deltaproteobacteria bacterium]